MRVLAVLMMLVLVPLWAGAARPTGDWRIVDSTGQLVGQTINLNGDEEVTILLEVGDFLFHVLATTENYGPVVSLFFQSTDCSGQPFTIWAWLAAGGGGFTDPYALSFPGRTIWLATEDPVLIPMASERRGFVGDCQTNSVTSEPMSPVVPILDLEVEFPPPLVLERRR